MLIQRYFHEKRYVIKADKPPQLLALGALLLASKANPSGTTSDPSALIKYIDYQFTLEQILDVELRIYRSLQQGLNLTFACDNLASMLQVSIAQLTSFLENSSCSDDAR